MYKTKVWNLELTTGNKTTVPLAPCGSDFYIQSHPISPSCTKNPGTSASVGCHKPRRRVENIREANRFAPSTRPPVTQLECEEMYLGTPFETQLNKWGEGGLWMMEKSWKIWKIGLKSSLYNQLSCLKHSLHLVIGFSWCNGRVIVSPGRAEARKC